jgi:pyruvate/2-oxoglutarate dehydrogenase complex dihydrolipoamide dehydrogenase (E3) component
MAATTRKPSAKPEKAVYAKQRVSPKAKSPDIAAKTVSVRSAVETDTLRNNVGLAEALREEGIDERTIARGFATLHSKLSNGEDKGDLKLFFDVLKDNHRTLEPPSPSDRNSASDAPITIILKHNVPRPAR